MAIVKVTNSKASIGKAISYVTKEEKTEDRLISGINCTPESAIDEMNATKEQFRKTEGRQYAHYIHSFKPGENIDHEQAHKLALELAEKQFEGYEVLVATHKDKDHVHSHIIVNSVSFENGQKFHSSKKDLAKVKEISNKICEREGLSITKPNRELTSFNMKKYKALERGYDKNDNYSSYMLELWKNVSSSIKVATSKEQFVENMNQKGYGVKWSDTRKYITFIPPKGKGRPIRNSTLAETFKNDKFSKEGLLNEFSRNGERLRERGIQGEQYRKPTSSPNVDWEAIERSTGSQEDRLSEQSSDGIVGEIQRKVRAVEERTDGATGKHKESDRELQEKQRLAKSEYERNARDLYNQSKGRDDSYNR
jgi:hypothetical protein